jgi:hypothetical protein
MISRAPIQFLNNLLQLLCSDTFLQFFSKHRLQKANIDALNMGFTCCINMARMKLWEFALDHLQIILSQVEGVKLLVRQML